MKNLLIMLIFFFYSGYSQKSQWYYESAGEKESKMDYHGAIEDYTQAIKLDDFKPINDYSPQDFKVLAYFYRGLVKRKLDNIIGEISDYTTAINLNVKSQAHENIRNNFEIEVRKERGIAKLGLGDYRGAISDFNLSLNLKNDNSSVHYYKALCLEGLKRYKEALNEYKSAIFFADMSHMSIPAIYYYRLGLIEIKIGEKDEGCLNLSKAGEMGEEDAYNKIKEYCK